MYAYDIHEPESSYSAEPLLHTDCQGLTLMRRGKDKDVYDLGDMLLMVSTDRLSAFGKSLGQGFAGKGKIVSQLSSYWFRKLRKIIPNHLVSANQDCFPALLRRHADLLDGRSILVWKTRPLPILCVVRGYLAGAGWQEYRDKGAICGTLLPEGLVESQRLPSPLFAPTIKGRAEENIDFTSLQQLLGRALAEQLREASLRLYFNAWKSARERGLLIADAKFEFGLHNGRLMLIDECLTPDTCRFWAIDSYRYGGPMPSMDRQVVDEFLGSPDDPADIPYLPDELLGRLGEKYYEVYRRIIGKRASARKEILGMRC